MGSPQDPHFKVNVATASFKSQNECGVGVVVVVVVRDWASKVLALYRDKITAVDCNLKMISVAMLKAVPYCYDSGFRDVLMECTNQKLISLIQHVDGYSIEIGEQLDDIHCVSVLFQGVRGPHCPYHDQFLMCTLSICQNASLTAF